jgi:hypothetical protein
VDIEADGPIPGPYSMLSFGACVAGFYEGGTFRAAKPGEQTFYRELKPISDDFVPEALAVCGLDRETLEKEGRTPEAAMSDAARWIEEICRDRYRPIFVAYPLGFDWLFSYWYFINFAGHSPFGFSGALDVKSFYAARAQAPIGQATKRHMPASLKPKSPHTHNALDDAIEQGELFANLVRWKG